jgi:hypothetical protein
VLLVKGIGEHKGAMEEQMRTLVELWKIWGSFFLAMGLMCKLLKLFVSQIHFALSLMKTQVCLEFAKTILFEGFLDNSII